MQKETYFILSGTTKLRNEDLEIINAAHITLSLFDDEFLIKLARNVTSE